jgi:hypothetical protein
MIDRGAIPSKRHARFVVAYLLMAIPTVTVSHHAVAEEKSPVNQEMIPVAEADATKTIVHIIEEQVNAAAAGGARPVTRDAHAKAHGCVIADVTVLPGLPKELREGVFAKPRSFRAWIRFSNGNGTPQDDHIGDGRGMAIKLTGVGGRKILAGESMANTQDFVMINYPVFFTRNAADYVIFQKLAAANKAGEFFRDHPHERQISEAITSRTIDQVFEQRYFSMTPYALGRHYIKFSALPIVCGSGIPITPSSASPPVGNPNYLRDGMTGWLKDKDACFNLAIQLQTDPAVMPVEDPTIEWDERKAPFVDVASIRITKQQFDSVAQRTFCENLSYTPWHSLAAHHPVGGINRIRKVVYETISKLRHRLNKAPRAEPTGLETFN